MGCGAGGGADGFSFTSLEKPPPLLSLLPLSFFSFDGAGVSSLPFLTLSKKPAQARSTGAGATGIMPSIHVSSMSPATHHIARISLLCFMPASCLPPTL